MVVRVFRVRVHPGKEDEFERFVIGTGMPMVKAQEGCTGGLSTLCGPSRVRIGKKG